MSAEVCGHVDMQGFDVMLECIRPTHADNLHKTEIGQQWECDEQDESA